ncbi:hypothetical protein O0I10_011648 [Lichtheimia ornata]|uniref:Uncharacterized protein n=1 Tax=Lichtheimia ornata TaxID=688661 RepID=A0AAD7XTV5_9FUNG|nr:uncharacterized protein O0I10_011648 [Lichtheimia ornata]KAJ8652703.1 hypothetical protein O0I10_011648 [Lichtheimia ornata]
MTVEENIVWSRILKDIVVTAQHGNDGNQIVAATKTLQQTAHQFAKVLNERARLLANSAQFDAALHDAAAIRAMIPRSGIGYLCTGDVYCQQGNHAAAIVIYHRGLKSVPKSDACYQQLQQHRKDAIANNNKRVDFVSRLPLDIVVTNIAPRLEPYHYERSEHHEPLYVSRAWRKRFLQQPNGLIFGFGEESETFARGHTELVRFAPYVQLLSGSFSDDVRLDDLFKRARFSNLKRLEITGDETSPRLPLVNGLRLIACTLTHLSIKVYPSVQLRDILETCPNLVFLDAENVDCVMPSSPSSRYPKITHLAIHEMPEEDRSHDNVIDILSRFPSLLSFEITPMPDSGVLTVLRNYFPYLQVLYFGDKNHSQEKKDVRPNGRKGVISAHLGGSGGNDYRRDDLLQFLHLNRNSLEELEFCGDIDDDDSFWKLENGKVIQQRDNQYSPLRSGDDDDPTQTGTSFMRLGSIEFTGAEPDACSPFITWLISNAPNLKTTLLNQSYIQSNVANAMIQSKRLSKLTLYERSADDEDYEGMIQFLQHHIEMGDQSTLEEIITYKISPEMAWIPLATRLKRLKKLKFLASDISEDCIPLMEQIGQGCPALKKLILGMPYAELPDGLLEPLYGHPSLEILKIGTRSLSANYAITLCTFKNLKSLELECDVSGDILDLLEYHLPKVELYPDPWR